MSDLPHLRDHWWPRPGWKPGDVTLTWHLTFEHDAELHRHVIAYQDALRDLPGLNPVPGRWLHLTMQRVGHVDETPVDLLPRIVDAVRDQVRNLSAFVLTFDRPSIYGEAIAIEPEPAEPARQLLNAVRAGLADVLGEDAVPPKPTHGFHPHVSIAYANIDTAAAPYQERIDTTDTPPVSVPITEISLIRQERVLEPLWLYRWTTEATAALDSTMISVHWFRFGPVFGPE